MLGSQAGFVPLHPDVPEVDRLPGQDAERNSIPNDGAGTGVFAAVYFEHSGPLVEVAEQKLPLIL